ncbi:hypothetical protein D9M72_271710 [compost metagenome]
MDNVSRTDQLSHKIPLSNIQDPAKQRLFLEYMDVALKKYSDSSIGSNYYNEEGDYVDESAINIKLNEKTQTLYIRIIATDNDELKSIEFECPESATVEQLTNSLIIQSLGDALGAKKRFFFRQVHYCYIGERLDGEYWIGNNIRIAPVDPDDPNPQFANTERYISIDLSVEAIDEYSAIAIANNRANRLAARLSLILNLGLYRPTNEYRWTLPEDLKGPSEIRALGYIAPGPGLDNLPRKGKVCKLGEYEHTIHYRTRYLGELIKFPTETRKLITAVDKSAHQLITAFDNCALLYQLALNAGRNMPSVQLSYLVASIDALSKSEKTNKSFGAFIRHYSHATHNIDHLIDFMHNSVRSAHFHAGEFPFGEFNQQSDIRIYRGSAKRISEHRFSESKKLIRTALANWAAILINESNKS